MTIKELCKKHSNCYTCPYLPVCGDMPADYEQGDDLEVTNAIIETAKALEPKTGHWIKEFNDLEGEVKFTCSRCGKYQPFETDFCYNCGSDNRVRGEE